MYTAIHPSDFDLTAAIRTIEGEGAEIERDNGTLRVRTAARPAMEVNFIVGRDKDARTTLEPAPVPGVSVELKSWLARAGNVDPAGNHLE